MVEILTDSSFQGTTCRGGLLQVAARHPKDFGSQRRSRLLRSRGQVEGLPQRVPDQPGQRKGQDL